MLIPPKEITLKNGQTVTLRCPAEADAEEMMRFIRQADTESLNLTREPGEFSLTPDEEREFIRARTEDPRSLWLVAELDGRVLASCSIWPVGKNRRLQHRSTIGIVVVKEYWRMSVGRAIMTACIEGAGQIGYEQVELEVVTGNERAIALYKSLGFEIGGTRKNAMKYADGSYTDEYFMVLPLNREVCPSGK